jgi:hypothetical protein
MTPPTKEEVRILAILRGLDYADQAKILESCKKSLKTIAERKESLNEWQTFTNH